VRTLEHQEDQHQKGGISAFYYIHFLRGKAMFLNQENENALIEMQKARELLGGIQNPTEKDEAEH